MTPKHAERLDLANRFANDVARMRRCLQAAGKEVEEDAIVRAWADYSGSVCAGWLMLPEEDNALVAILRQHLPQSRLVWRTTVEVAGDGGGDVMLVLPKELLVKAGWNLDDKLVCTLADSGALILQRVE
jgi:hypothetical protein